MNNSKPVEKPRILLVEDDLNLGFLLVDFLESNGFDVKLYKDGETGLKGFTLNPFDFCIIDLMLPRKDGFSLIEEIKTLRKDIPTIILSARSLKDDKIKGFRLGIDDYITKPFDEEELLYRIKAILSRVNSNTNESSSIFKMGKYEFDTTTRILSTEGYTQRLTSKESRILEILIRAKGKVVKKDNIMIEVWGESGYFTARSLDVFISKLRNYLKEDSALQIVTIPTVGYVLEEK